MDRSLVNVVGRYNTTVYRVPNSAITGVYSAQTRRRRTLTVTRCVNVGRLDCFFFPPSSFVPLLLRTFPSLL